MFNSYFYRFSRLSYINLYSSSSILISYTFLPPPFFLSGPKSIQRLIFFLDTLVNSDALFKPYLFAYKYKTSNSIKNVTNSIVFLFYSNV